MNVTLVVPGSLETRTGGSTYDRRIAEGLRARGWDVTVIETDPITHPLEPPLHTAPKQFASIPDGTLVLVDGLVFGSMPEIAERDGRRLRFVPIVHLALRATPGLPPGDVKWLENIERRSLAHARHVVITGFGTLPQIRALAGHLREHGVTLIRPGATRASRVPRQSAGTLPLQLLCVATVNAGKGHDILIRALAQVPTLDWRLTCAGSLARDGAAVAWTRALIEEHRLHDQVALVGELDDAALEAQYAKADLFVLATRGETYGMAVAEAIGHGLPVVSTRTGEIASIAGDGALLVDPGDPTHFAEALTRAMTDTALRERLAEGARIAAESLPTWDEAAEKMSAVLEEVARG